MRRMRERSVTAPAALPPLLRRCRAGLGLRAVMSAEELGKTESVDVRLVVGDIGVQVHCTRPCVCLCVCVCHYVCIYFFKTNTSEFTIHSVLLTSGIFIKIFLNYCELIFFFTSVIARLVCTCFYQCFYC